MNSDDLAQEVRCLKAELRDAQNRFAEEGARLNTEIALWKLRYFQACALIPDGDLPIEYELEGIRLDCADARFLPGEDSAYGVASLADR